MAAQKGKDILLKIGDGQTPENFTTVAGIKARTLSLNAKTVDVTNSDSLGGWRELLATAGVRAATLSGSGVFRDAASDALICNAFFNQTLADWQVIIPDFGQVAGPFQITTLDYAGQHDGEATFSLTLASGGALSFTAIP